MGCAARIKKKMAAKNKISEAISSNQLGCANKWEVGCMWAAGSDGSDWAGFGAGGWKVGCGRKVGRWVAERVWLRVGRDPDDGFAPEWKTLEQMASEQVDRGRKGESGAGGVRSRGTRSRYGLRS